VKAIRHHESIRNPRTVAQNALQHRGRRVRPPEVVEFSGNRSIVGTFWHHRREAAMSTGQIIARTRTRSVTNKFVGGAVRRFGNLVGRLDRWLGLGALSCVGALCGFAATVEFLLSCGGVISCYPLDVDLFWIALRCERRSRFSSCLLHRADPDGARFLRFSERKDQ